RWRARALGWPARRLSGERRTAVLESQVGQRTGPAAGKAAGERQGGHSEDLACRGSRRSDEAAQRVPQDIWRRESQSGGYPRQGLGAVDGVLRLPERTLETSAHNERHRIAIQYRAIAHVSGEALQASRQRNGDD